MKRDRQRWFLLLVVIAACLVLPACGGGEGGQVTGDSPEGIPIDSALEDEVGEGGEAFPEGGAGVEPDDIGPEDSLTDGQ